MENIRVHTIRMTKESKSRDEFASGQSFTFPGLSAVLQIRVPFGQGNPGVLRECIFVNETPINIDVKKPAISHGQSQERDELFTVSPNVGALAHPDVISAMNIPKFERKSFHNRHEFEEMRYLSLRKLCFNQFEEGGCTQRPATMRPAVAVDELHQSYQISYTARL